MPTLGLWMLRALERVEYRRSRIEYYCAGEQTLEGPGLAPVPLESFRDQRQPWVAVVFFDDIGLEIDC